MDSPPYLLDQYAKARGLSANNAKRALMLTAFAADGRAIVESARALKVSAAVAKMIARKFLIDFPDYRPYSGLEKKGLPRPLPRIRQDRDASELPLFGVPA